MRKLFLALIIAFFLVLGAILAVSLATINSIRREAVKQALTAPESYHFGAVMPSSLRDAYYLRAANAMTEIGAKNKAVVQFFEYETTDGADSVLRLLKMVGELGLDGVVLSMPESPAFLPVISDMDSSGVPVVTLETDLPGSKRRAFVGSNEFELGRQAGTLAGIGQRQSKVKAAIVLSSRYQDSPNRRNSLLLGFTSAINKSGKVELSLVRSTLPDSLSGEEVVWEILERRPDIGLIVATSARDTAEAAQSIIEFNQVGKVALIGFDDTAEILRLIESGVIQATLARDPEKAGRESILALLALRSGSRVNAYVDSGIHLVDKAGLAGRVGE
jgi:ribose transport system substrate-binding protein